MIEGELLPEISVVGMSGECLHGAGGWYVTGVYPSRTRPGTSSMLFIGPDESVHSPMNMMTLHRAAYGNYICSREERSSG